MGFASAGTFRMYYGLIWPPFQMLRRSFRREKRRWPGSVRGATLENVGP